jgi:hypothetical protein
VEVAQPPQDSHSAVGPWGMAANYVCVQSRMYVDARLAKLVSVEGCSAPGSLFLVSTTSTKKGDTSRSMHQGSRATKLAPSSGPESGDHRLMIPANANYGPNLGTRDLARPMRKR